MSEVRFTLSFNSLPTSPGTISGTLSVLNQSSQQASTFVVGDSTTPYVAIIPSVSVQAVSEIRSLIVSNPTPLGLWFPDQQQYVGPYQLQAVIPIASTPTLNVQARIDSVAFPKTLTTVATIAVTSAERPASPGVVSPAITLTPAPTPSITSLTAPAINDNSTHAIFTPPAGMRFRVWGLSIAALSPPSDLFLIFHDGVVPFMTLAPFDHGATVAQLSGYRGMAPMWLFPAQGVASAAANNVLTVQLYSLVTGPSVNILYATMMVSTEP